MTQTTSAPQKHAGSSIALTRIVLFVFCAFVFLLPLKFGNPIVLESISVVPRGGWDWFFSLWPNQIALIVALLLFAWSVWTSTIHAQIHSRAFWLPCAFLATQLASTPTSITPQVSLDTVVMFAAGIGLYAIGLLHFGRADRGDAPIAALVVSSALVCLVTIQQYFGGLEETRRYFALYFDTENVAEDYLIKLQGDRPFGTFVYPNSLGGFLVLALPVVAGRIWKLRGTWEKSAVWVVLVAVVGLMLFSLVLSGSKGAFLTLAGVVGVAVLLVPMSNKFKLSLILMLALCGGALLFRYGPDVFRYGLSTGGARIDYWNAALRIFADHPWLGTGPGTFGSIYPKYKLLTSEDPRLAHNNFLEALSDSGIFGFLAYTTLWIWPLCVVIRRMRRTTDPMMIGLTLSLVAWVMHGLVDFDQYIPSLALLAFFFLGMLEGLQTGKPLPVRAGAPLKLIASSLAVLLCVLPLIRLKAIAWYGESKRLSGTNLYASSAAIERAIRFAPLDAFYNYQQARLSAQLGRSKEALLHFYRARSLDPYRSMYAWETAQFYRASEALTESYFRTAEEAVSLAPKNWKYREVLARDYERIGLREQATRHWSAYREIRRGLNLAESERHTGTFDQKTGPNGGTGAFH